jgi:adenosylcobinamide-phosphate synthase
MEPVVLSEWFSNYPALVAAVTLLAALSLDQLLGEPTRFHPLVGYGWLVNRCEGICRALTRVSPRWQGRIAWMLAVGPLVLLSALLLDMLKQLSPLLWFVANSVMLYLTIGGRSLIQHADNIYQPLSRGDLDGARYQVSMIVSRNTDKMGEKEITSSAVESVLENGNDAVFGPMVWFLLLGVPGALLFRLANTLDAMWGYKNERYLDFGRFAAKSDDLLGWLPARITAVCYAFQGRFNQAVWCWSHQAKNCSSPNGGVVMTAGAGALGVSIGGPTYYHGVLHDKKPMGTGEPAGWQVIPLANQLVNRGSFALAVTWLVSVLAVTF